MNDLKYLKQRLEQLIETRAIKINSGNIPNFKIYKQIVGELTGLSLAINEIDDLQRKQREADDV